MVFPPPFRGLDVVVDMFDAVFVYEEVDLPTRLFDGHRGQWRADLVARHLGARRARKIPHVYVIEGDGYVPGFNFVFGLALPDIGVAVVFTERLKGSRLAERLSKEVTHEAGHLYGLGHCADPACVMSFSNSVVDVDAKSHMFCGLCRARLVRSRR